MISTASTTQWLCWKAHTNNLLKSIFAALIGNKTFTDNCSVFMRRPHSKK